jgi:tripartite-type tricarboxylate transporter receptor subunit TctC
MMNVISGHITMMFDITSSAHNFINANQVRAIAVTSRDRNVKLPTIPTMRESGNADFEVGGWYAIFGPLNMSLDLVERYNKAVQAVLSNPEFRTKLIDGGYEIWTGSSKDLADQVYKDSLLWATVTKNINFD